MQVVVVMDGAGAGSCGVVVVGVVVVFACFTAYFGLQLVTLKDQTPCHLQSLPPPLSDFTSPPPTPSSPSIRLAAPEVSAPLPLSPAFPCQLPFYGDASCSLLQVRSFVCSSFRSRVILTKALKCFSIEHFSHCI
jgi:hypothetical protein